MVPTSPLFDREHHLHILRLHLSKLHRRRNELSSFTFILIFQLINIYSHWCKSATHLQALKLIKVDLARGTRKWMVRIHRLWSSLQRRSDFQAHHWECYLCESPTSSSHDDAPSCSANEEKVKCWCRNSGKMLTAKAKECQALYMQDYRLQVERKWGWMFGVGLIIELHHSRCLSA